MDVCASMNVLPHGQDQAVGFGSASVGLPLLQAGSGLRHVVAIRLPQGCRPAHASSLRRERQSTRRTSLDIARLPQCTRTGTRMRGTHRRGLRLFNRGSCVEGRTSRAGRGAFRVKYTSWSRGAVVRERIRRLVAAVCSLSGDHSVAILPLMDELYVVTVGFESLHDFPVFHYAVGSYVCGASFPSLALPRLITFSSDARR